MNTGATLLHDVLSSSAARLPDKVALVHGGDRVTYAAIDARSNALAHALVKRGVARGDRVVVFAENSVEAVIAFWGVLKANAVVSVVSPRQHADTLAYQLRDSRARVLISQEHLAAVFTQAIPRSPHLATTLVASSNDLHRDVHPVAAESLAHAVGSERTDAPPARACLDIDLASIIYTSGSTGEPKGVMLTHRNMLAAATSIVTYLENVSDDVILSVLPLYFDYGLYQMIMAFYVGARLVLERGFAFPAEVLNVAVKERVTGFPGVPTLFSMLGDMDKQDLWDMSSVRYVTNTAAALSPKHIAAMKKRFPSAKIYSMYGLTECKRCTYLPPADLEHKPHSVGIPIPNTEAWIVDHDGRRVPPNTAGELVIRGATVMAGYWDKPEESARILRPGPLPGERVLHTGDVCSMDEDGYVTFIGRMDDVIKSRGEKVPPKQVELALLEVPGVKDAAVIGVHDDVLGQAPKAFVVLDPGVTISTNDLRRMCQLRLEPFMVPKFFEVVPSLPTFENGKVNKRALVRAEVAAEITVHPAEERA